MLVVTTADKQGFTQVQAPRAWNTKLHAVLVSLGFEQSASEHAVYTRGKDKSRLLLGVYVDDLELKCFLFDIYFEPIYVKLAHRSSDGSKQDFPKVKVLPW